MHFQPRLEVLYLPKPGRDCGSAKSYGPISLSSFFLKTLERIIEIHIRDTVLSVKPLHSNQFAYQPGKSTVAALQALKKKINKF